jgi:L,D-transpeptidase YcbB
MLRFLSAAALVLALPACSTNAPAGTTGEAPCSEPDGVPVMAAVGAHQIPVADIGAAIEGCVSAVGAGSKAGDATELRALYDAAGRAPLWLDGRARPSRGARVALDLLIGAQAEGLDPVDYGAAALEARAAVLGHVEAPQAERMAAFDVDLSLAMLRFLRHVHAGRLDPRTVGFRLTVPADDHGFAALVASAVADGRVGELVAEVRPPIPPYEPLLERLAEYRVRAASEALEPLSQLSSAVRPGDAYADLPALARRLVATGDLAVDDLPQNGTSYDGPLVEALTRFQVRHGLEADGVLGKATLEALSVPLAWRARQIELALERLRWLPHLTQGRVVFVNIPMFHLWSWDRLSPAERPAFGTGIIVGRALGTETPVFVEDMRYVVFRPYWNVPPSILRGEILPRIVRDPAYLRRENMEIVWGQGDNAQAVEATADNLALLRQGALRVRQRPGPRNALGLVKFMFPNAHNVYLHGTPAPELFTRARRDFSHGCVRVANPAGLAAWVLAEQPEWTAERIQAAMARGADSRVVTLSRPVQVILAYVTAMAWPEDGSMRFAADIYRHDRRLDQALTKRN